MARAPDVRGERSAPHGRHRGHDRLTTAQVRATHLPTVLAATITPGFCVVLAGTNGVGTVTLQSQMDDLIFMWSALRSAGITPIACTIPPSGAASVADNSATVKLNTYIKRYCKRNRIICADVYAALVDAATGAYVSAYDSGDHIHPSAAGAQVIANAVWAVMEPSRHPPRPNCRRRTPNFGMLLGDANGTFQTTGSTTGGNYPNNWGRPSAPSGVTVTVAPETGVVGNFFTVTSGAGGTAQWWSPNVTAPAGRRIYVGFKVKAAPVGGGSWSARIEASDGTGNVCGFDALTTPVTTATEVGFEFDMPSGITTSLRLWIIPTGNGTVVGVGQVTAMDLTALGHHALNRAMNV